MGFFFVNVENQFFQKKVKKKKEKKRLFASINCLFEIAAFMNTARHNITRKKKKSALRTICRIQSYDRQADPHTLQNHNMFSFVVGV